MAKYVYLFKEADGDDKAKFGGKGANLAKMTSWGMPVPEGFTITTEACTKYYDDGETISGEIIEQIFDALAKVEKDAGKKFGDEENPFLVSVRSGARASMPGMMDTILNLGLNDVSVKGLARKTGNPRFAYDCYRRFIQMFSDVVMGSSKSSFEKIIDELKEEKGVKMDTELTAEDLQELIAKFKKFYKEDQGQDFPQDPKVQLIEAVKAVFRSWNNPRAIVYRRMNDIPSSWGTAVNVQSMVFGNMGDTSGTGVAFTRDPATGEKRLFGEYLMNAQGEDVVAGIRTPMTIDHLKETNPDVYKQFVDIANRLEQANRDMQDMEFTIEEGKLYMLQTRNGKRTARAAIKIACDLVNEGMITKQEALLKIEPKQLDALLHPTFNPAVLKKTKELSKGLPASPGAACGKVAFSAEEAVARHKNGEKVVLVRLETSPEDIEGMYAAEGPAAWAHAASPDAPTSRSTKRRRSSGSRTKSSPKTTTSPSTAPPDLSTAKSCRQSRLPCPATSPRSWSGRTRTGLCRSVPTPTLRTTQRSRSSSAPRVSVFAVPSTCSSPKTASSRSER